MYEARTLLGRCFYYQNNLKKASYEFEAVLDAHPGAPGQDSALYWTGDIYYRSGDFKNALEYYQKAMDNYPDSKYFSYAVYSKAWSYYKLNFLEDAASIFGDVVSRYPMDRLAIDSLFKIGECEYLLGKYEEAQASLNNFIDRYPLSERASEGYCLLGDISLRQEKYADSLLFFKRALSISPQARWRDIALFGMAQDYFNINNFDESIKMFKDCVKESANAFITGNSLLGLLRNYEKKALAEDALKTCNIISSRFPRTDIEAESYYIRAKILYNNNMLSQAEDVCLKGADKFLSSGNTGKIHYELGWVYLKENKVKEALAEFRAAVKCLGDDTLASGALCKIGDIYFNSGEYGKAAKSFDDSLKRHPDSPWADYAQYRIGGIFLSEKKYDLAILAYQSLLVNFPQTGLKGKAILNSGVAYFKQGLFPQALAEFKKLSGSFPKLSDDAAYKFYLASSLYNLNRYEEALEIFKLLAKSAPGSISLMAQYQTGWCYYRMDKGTDAADSFTAFLKKYPDSELSKDALHQCASILLGAARNFEKWKMPGDAARLYKRLEELRAR